ncbi:amino acid adenylation domain-containing protein [Paraneptunicella aestuarii]|uniref:non-ribosomal peptide synthetase n=1 Tax=Paraneptunicella aestuarii TaxID=2831148 RepID=UPI001E460A17|nr:non-ribosomal peptide synthetase [Paraneptunicella aestuarii]UAA37425.1 amino acid adenylation domain-containing protein [Paraneptunicella aestuarii]
MKFVEILSLCEKEGIELSVKDGALRVVATKNKVSDEIKEILKANKLLLLSMLGGDGEAYEDDTIVADPDLQRSPQLTSFAQRRIWLESTLSEDKAIYNTRCSGVIRGALNADMLEAALNAIIKRHAILRTVYLDEQGEPMQQVLQDYTFTMQRYDHTQLTAEQQEAQLKELVDREMVWEFDLSSDIPIRAHLIKRRDEEHELIFTIHHIATDGWSTGIFFRELNTFYAALLEGKEAPLDDLPIQYIDYSVWQRSRLQGKQLEKLLDYWRDRLDGVATLHQLPLDFERKAEQSHKGSHYNQILPRSLAEQLEKFSSAHQSTMFITLQSLFAVLVSRYSNTRDVLMGSATANRIEGQVQPLLGCFLNNLVLRTDIDDELSVAEFLKRQKMQILSDFEKQHIPFELLVEQINPERSLAFHPLVQIMFGYENNDYSGQGSQALDMTRREMIYEISKFDLSLHAGPIEEGIEVSWGYSKDVFKHETIGRMATAYEALLRAAIANPDTLLKDLPLVSDVESQALSVLAMGEALPAQTVLVPAQLSALAASQADAQAVVMEAESLSFGELEAQSNLLARALVKSGVKAGDRVGMCLDRSVEMVVAVLGIMKSGGVYVPLDPTYPDERLSYLIQDAGISHVVTEVYLADQLPLNDQQVLLVSECIDDSDERDEETETAVEVALTASTPAYMIYTSGSTGQPKGVLVNHGALAQRLAGLQNHYGLNSTDKGLLFASMSFDASLSQLLLPLCAGAAVVIRPDDVTEPEALMEYIQETGVSFLHVVPAYLKQLVAVSGWQDSRLRIVVSGGDVFDTGLLDSWFNGDSASEREGIALYNSYGPTEIVITSSSHRVSVKALESKGSAPIGKPLANTSYWIVDAQGQLLPQGVVGELCIGGDSLAEGYWQREAQTAERFVELRFNNTLQRVYRTGDRAKWNDAGELVFVGRQDNQVKVRGYRIELGEIEAALKACQGVTEAVVKAEDDGLWAFLSLDENRTTLTQVEEELATHLPGYLLPSGFETITEWPLTASGKIDRNKLVRGLEQDSGSRAPKNDTEIALQKIWAELLKVEEVGVTDNFFQMGGHSLLATRLASQIRRQFEVNFTLKSLFELPSIEEQAAMIVAEKGLDDSNDANDRDEAKNANQSNALVPNIKPLTHQDPVPLSFAQKRLWIMSELENTSSSYNSAFALSIDGDLNIQALEQAFSAIIERHQVLRSVIRLHEGEPVQCVLNEFDFAIEQVDLSHLAGEALDSAVAEQARLAASRAFDLSADVLLRATLLHCGNARHILVLTLHHIACDGWSMPILSDELNRFYTAFASNKESVDLTALPIQYRDYANWQHDWLRGEVLDEALGYWTNRLSGIPDVHQLPLDRARPVQPSYRGAVFTSRISPEVKGQLEQLSQAHQATLFMTVQTAFSVLLSRFSGEDDIVMGTAIANREQQEISDLIGLFANTLVLRTGVESGVSFDALLGKARQDLLSDFAHQHLPFELLVEHMNPTRQLSYNPLFQIMLLWQNNESSEIQLSQDLHFSDYALERNVSKFELTLSVIEDAGGLSLYWRYATDLFDEDSVKGWAEAFEVLLKGIALAPQTDVKRLPLLTESNKALMQRWNNTNQHFDYPAGLHQWFEQQVESNPNAVALEANDDGLTYAELNARANAVAHELMAKGVQADSVVGVCTHRRSHMLVAMLGVMKSGAAYMPLDPNYPVERLQYMLQDSEAQYVVGEADCIALLSHDLSKSIVLGQADSSATSDNAPDIRTPDIRISSEQLAYVIYTSGSTGRPKGVMVSHGAVNHFIAAAKARLSANDTAETNANWRWLAVTAMSFDISILELFLPLCVGGTVVLADSEQVVDGKALIKLLSKDIDVMQATPATWKLLQESDWQGQEQLKILVGGEYVPESLGKWLVSCGKAVWNCYGPTESTIWTHIKPMGVNGQMSSQSVSDLGGLLNNVQQCVVAPVGDLGDGGLGKGELAPIGGVGELWLGGAGLARGYWHKDELTEQQFVTSDVLGETQRWYRTGDWVHQKRSGELGYLGRIDQQVKIRGYRIETGEIEQCLLGLDEVKDAVVHVHRQSLDNSSGSSTDSSTDAMLVGYVVLQDTGSQLTGSQLDESRWRERVQAMLPSYMHPAVVMTLDALPLTANGKIDRKALSQPEYQPAFTRGEFTAATTETEQMLVGLWQDLLGIEEVSATANFFQLGGHSLLATRMLNRLRETLSTSVELKQVFLNPTIRELAAYIDNLDNLQSTDGDSGLLPQPPALIHLAEQGRGLASYAQTRLWFLEKLRPVPGAYHVNSLLRITQPLNEAAFKRAINALVQRHASLRTHFEMQGDELYQVIADSVAIDVPVFDLTHYSDDEQKAKVTALCDEQKYHHMDLGADSLMQVRVLKTHAEQALIFFTFHHIITDGWSSEIFLRELDLLYKAYCEQQDVQLEELQLSYLDYASWQRRWLSNTETDSPETDSPRMDSLTSYWQERLNALPQVHQLPLDFERPAQPSFVGAIHRIQLSADKSQAFKALLKAQNTSLFVGLKATFGVLLARYSGEQDIVLGSAIANRPHNELEKVMGYFANTLVMRQQFTRKQSFLEVLQQAQDEFLNDVEHQDIPFEVLVESLNPERDLAINPLFQIMLVLQNLGTNQGGDAGLFESINQDNAASQFDITLAVRDEDEGLVLAWRYATDLFASKTIETLASALESLITQVVQQPEANVHALPILSAEEIERQVNDWNQTVHEFEQSASLAHQLFEYWAEHAPDNIAVTFQGESLSYAELNTQANQLARALMQQVSQEAAIGQENSGSLIAICMQPSIEMVVSLLAVLKSGAAYLPVDPAYPQARVQHILHDSGAKIVLVNDDSAGSIFNGQTLSDVSIKSVNVAMLRAGELSHFAGDNLGNEVQISQQDLAYAIYTSGSTGLPKGVLLEHAGLVNHALSQSRLFDVTSRSKVMQYAALSFDVATCEIFIALSRGAELHVMSKEIKQQPDALSRYISDHGLTHIMLIPSVLALLSSDLLVSVKSIIVGGESISQEQADFWSQEHRLFNAYGPSEATICALAEEYQGRGVAIGLPIDNMQAYILDSNLKLVPQGVPGELYLSGIGLARGYLNQPDLTRERFIQHRFENGQERRLYQTGDLVRRLPDGRMEFLGRSDSQVKVRGYRIETDEVNNKLAAVPGVSQCAVAAKVADGYLEGSAEKILVAYVVADNALNWNDLVTEIKASLTVSLPGYMMPSAFVQLDALPLLDNGKVDLKALPAPHSTDLYQISAYEAPKTELQIQLCNILMDVLSLPKIGLADNFFQLGGNSILAMKLVARINQECDVQVPLVALFESSSVRALAETIEDYRRGGSSLALARPAIQPLSQNNNSNNNNNNNDNLNGSPLSYEQKRTWFLQEVDEHKSVYNASMCLSIDGDLNIQALEQAFSAIIERHQVLRSVIRLHEGEPVQCVLNEFDFAIEQVDLSHLAGEALDSAVAEQARLAASRAFDLSADVLLRATLLHCGNARHILVLTLHHIACDGWSMPILSDELNRFYAAFASNKESVDLTALPIQYRDYANWQHDWLRGEVLDEALGYWTNRLSGIPDVHQLPLDRARPVQPSYRGAVFTSRISPEVKGQLEQLSQAHQATLFMTVQTAFSVLLSRFSGEDDIVMGTAIANREQQEISDLIGLFANTLVLRTGVESGVSFDALLGKARQDLLSDFAHQHLPFELLVEHMNPTRQLSYNPLFQIMLLWQNNESSEIQLSQDLHFSDYALERNVSKFELTLSVIEDAGGLSLYWRYATDLFDEDSVKGWAEAFEVLLKGIALAPQTDVKRLPLLTESNKALMQRWNNTNQHFDYPAGLHQWFEQQVESNPNAVALEANDDGLTYAELNARANAVAHELMAKGVQADSVVGVCTHRRSHMLVAMLGVMKSGAAYMPLDPNYPVERLQYMLQDSEAQYVVGEGDCIALLGHDLSKSIVVEQIGSTTAHQDIRIPDIRISSEQLAYVIYTSGSTGRPKGVMVSHGAVNHFIAAAKARLSANDTAETNANWRWLAVTAMSFDISILELFLPLCVGGTVVLADSEQVVDGKALIKLLSKDIDVMQATPATWKLLQESDWQGQEQLKILVGGEYVPESLGKWLVSCGKAVWNCYGPTESTIWTHIKPMGVNGQMSSQSVSDLGGLLNNVQQCVVAAEGELAPIGGVGELWLGGAGLARGYWHKDELTEQQFVTSDVLGETQRWYRTGDWVHQKRSGELGYLGRIDQQVKIRGYRIETGEIEQCLLGLDEVKDAVVHVHRQSLDNSSGSSTDSSTDAMLVGYVVLQDTGSQLTDSQLEESRWRERVQAMLPSYMHPAVVMTLDALPLTANGKIDRKALSQPEYQPAFTRGEFTAATTETEQMLVGLWQDLLGIEEVSATANFFQLGGHSLLATRLVAQLAESLSLQVPIKVIFTYPTIQQLGEWIDIARQQHDVAAMQEDALQSSLGAPSDEVVI